MTKPDPSAEDCGVVGDWSDGTTRGAKDVELFVALTRTTPDAARS
jgi:hypothetical protein